MSGTLGTDYALTCMVTQPGGSSSSQSVKGSVPADYSFSGNMISCVAQEHDNYGETLRMEVLKAGILVQTSSTNAPYGIAQIATQ